MLKALEYKTIYEKIMDALGELLLQTEYGEKYKEFAEELQEISGRDKIHIVVAGGWSTGKSTLIKALTGDESIGIDSDVKTEEAHKYEYHGLCIVDTPGLHSGNDEHTQRAEDEIKNADRIVYCITAQQLFSSKTKEEFAAITERKDLIDRVILAVTKFGLEATNDENPLDALDRIDDGIVRDLEEAGVEEDCYDICIFSAKRYMDGKKDNIPEMVEASYFEEFMYRLEEGGGSDNKIEESLSYRKCRQEGEKIYEFISGIKKEISDNCSDEEKRESLKMGEKLQRKIQASKEEAKRSFHTEVVELKDFIIELCRDEAKSEADIKAQIENRLDGCLTSLNALIEKQVLQIENSGVVPFFVADNAVIKIRPAAEKGGFRLFEKMGNKFFFSHIGKEAKSGIETVNKLAEPVKKKGGIFKPKVLSDIGGEGTALYSALVNFSPKYGGKLSLTVGKISGKLAGSAKLLDKAGSVLDLGLTLGNSLKEQSDEKRRRQKRKKFRCALNAEISELENSMKEVIDDGFGEISKKVGMEYVHSDSANGQLISGLEKQLHELTKLTDDFKC